MRKMLIALLIGLVLILPGCSLVFPGSESTASETETTHSAADYSHEFENNWCYLRLEQKLKVDYQDVYTAVREGFNKNEKITIKNSDKGTQKECEGIKIKLSQPLNNRTEAQRLYTAFITDNPQLFYIGNYYSYEGYRVGNMDCYNIFYLVYTMDVQQRAIASQKLESVIMPILKETQQKAGGSQFKQELLLHDKLMELCTYEERANTDQNPIANYPTAFSSYGALVEGRAVCEGYSRAMQLLLHRSGIECTLVSGYDDKKTSHMWNFVTIDGRNYHLDPTWDDSDNLKQYTYFNLTTEEITRSHILDVDNIGIDTCTATDANYYRCSGLLFNTSKRDDIAKVIAEKVRNGETVIDMQFTRSTFASARLFVNNRNLLTEKVNTQLKQYNMTMWDYQKYNINETYYTITLYKS